MASYFKELKINRNYFSKIILFILISFFFSNNLYSQLKIGFETGISISELKSNMERKTFETSRRNGLILGVRAYIPFSKSFRLAIQPRYIQKGGKSEWRAVDITQYNKVEIDYIDIPVYLNYMFIKSKFTFYLLSGFTVSHCISDKNEVVNDGFNTNNSYKTKMNANLRDYSIDVGIGTDYNIYEKFSVLFEIKNSFGLKDVDYSGRKNNSLQFTFGGLWEL